MKKIITSGLVAGVAMFVISFGTSFMAMMSPELRQEYANPALFRQMDDPLTMFFFIHPFISAIILAFLWDKTKTIIPVYKYTSRGALFGMIYWLVLLPGIFMSYACSPYSLNMVVSWIVPIFIQAVVAGIIFESLNGLPEAE